MNNLLVVDRPQTQIPLHFYKGKEVISDENEESHCLSKKALRQPTHNMLASFMKKDPELQTFDDLFRQVYRVKSNKLSLRMDIEPRRNYSKISNIIFTKYKKMCKSLFERLFVS